MLSCLDADSGKLLWRKETKGVPTFFTAAIEIAAPLLAALFLAEISLGLLSRAAPQLNVFVLGFPLKILLTLLLAGLALPLLPDAVSSLLEHTLRAGGSVVRAFG